MINKEMVRHYCGELVSKKTFTAIKGGDEIVSFFLGSDRDCTGDQVYLCQKCSEALDPDFCGNPYLIDPMPESVAQRISTTRLCSLCWGFSFEYHDAKTVDGEGVGVYLVCVDCKEDTIGFVSTAWKDHATAEDYIYYKDDAPAISEALGVEIPEDLTRKPRSSAEALHELGYY